MSASAVSSMLPSKVIVNFIGTFYGIDCLVDFPTVAAKLFAELKNQNSITDIPRNFSQIAPQLKGVFDTIQAIFLLTVTLPITINLVSHLIPDIPNPFGNTNSIDVNQTLLDTDRALDGKIASWNTALDHPSADNYQALKEEVSLQCKELTDLLRKIRSQSRLGVPEAQLASLRELVGKLEPVLAKLLP